MRKYVENRKKYVALGIVRVKHRPLSLYIKALALGEIPKSPHIGSGTEKNSVFQPLYRLWDLEERSKVQVVIYIYLSLHIKAVGIGIIPSPPHIG